MDLKHNNQIPAHANVCLADLCPIFGCSYILKTHSGESATGSKTKTSKRGSGGSFTDIEPCSSKDVDLRKENCTQILNRLF